MRIEALKERLKQACKLAGGEYKESDDWASCRIGVGIGRDEISILISPPPSFEPESQHTLTISKPAPNSKTMSAIPLDVVDDIVATPSPRPPIPSVISIKLKEGIKDIEAHETGDLYFEIEKED